MKKILVVLVVFAAVFTTQISLKSSKSSSDFTLNQLVQKAEACAEVGGANYQCCVSSDSWCYIGGGYMMSPFYAMY